MAFALVAEVKAIGNDTFSTSAIDTTGADLLVATFADTFAEGSPPTLSDSEGNTWVAAVNHSPFGNASRIHYAWNATVGASHTFTLTGTDMFGSLQVRAYSGSDTSADPFDQTNENLAFGSTTVTTGSVTPTTDGQLLVAACTYDVQASLPTIDGGFDSPTYGDLGSGGSYLGSSNSYLIQTTAAAANPTFTGPSGSNKYATIATFKVNAGTPGTATPAAISLAVTMPAATATSSDNSPSVVSSVAAALSTNDPAVTFPGTYVPAEDDVVVLFISSTTVMDVVADASLPSGWVNPLGDGVNVDSDAHGVGILYHLVTAGEETAVTLTYTATNALAAAETGNVIGVAVRDVDPASVIDSINTTFDSTNTVTPAVLASLTGTNLSDDSLVLRYTAQDNTATFTEPASHTEIVTSNTNQGSWLGRLDGWTTAGGDVAATDITPDAGDEYASITVALTKSAGGDGTATPGAIALAATLPAATTQAGATTSPAATSLAVAMPAAAAGSDATATPAAIPITVDMFTAAVEQGGDAEPAATSVVVALPQAAASGQTDDTATPDVIATAVTLSAVTTQAGSASTPAAIVTAVTLPSATTAAGATVTPDEIVIAVDLPAATASGAGNATAEPAAITIAVDLPAATTQAGATASPDAIPIVVTIPAATASGSDAGTATPATITTSVTMPAPATQAGSTVAPATTTLAVTFPQATAQASHTAAPDTITVPITIDAVTATGATSGTATPNAIALVTVIPSPTLEYGSTVSPDAIALAISIAAAVASGLLPETVPVSVTLVGADYTITASAAIHTATFVRATSTMIGDA